MNTENILSFDKSLHAAGFGFIWENVASSLGAKVIQRKSLMPRSKEGSSHG